MAGGGWVCAHAARCIMYGPPRRAHAALGGCVPWCGWGLWGVAMVSGDVVMLDVCLS